MNYWLKLRKQKNGELFWYYNSIGHFWEFFHGKLLRGRIIFDTTYQRWSTTYWLDCGSWMQVCHETHLDMAKRTLEAWHAGIMDVAHA